MVSDASSEEKQDSPPNRADARRRWKRLLLRMCLAVLIGLVTLKIGDVVVGRTRDTHNRHLFRLAPNSATRHDNKEFDYVFHTNALGFRGPDVPFERRENSRRIVVIGDSFVAGVGVDDESVFTSRLAEALNVESRRTEVVNLGRSGSSTIREFDLYERFGTRFQPDEVILVVFLGNDLAEIVEEHNREELEAWHPAGWIRRCVYGAFPNLYLELAMARQAAATEQAGRRSETQFVEQLRNEANRRGVDAELAEKRLHDVPGDIRIAARNGRFSLTRLYHGLLDPHRIRRSLNPDDDFFNRAWPRMVEHLDKLNAAVRRDGARMRMVALPAAVQVDPAAVDATRQLGYVVDDTWLTSTSRIQTELTDWAKSRGVDYFDLTDALRQAPAPLYHIWDRHLNKRGHDVMATTLAEWLQPETGGNVTR